MPEPERVRDDSFPMRGWGLPEPGELDRVVVISPHLDDAVLSCARFIAAHSGVTVVTVFAGNPPAYPSPQRLWDAQSGFAPDDDVMAARRTEDATALAVLAARPVHLNFIEHTYLPNDTPVAPDVIAPVLGETLRDLQPTLVVAPFGLANPDHDVTHKACMLARDALGDDVSWWCYEDTGYKHIPGMLAWRVSRLFRRNLWPTPVCPPVDEDNARKMKAVNCYPSQMHALDDDWNIREKLASPPSEQYWRLAPPPSGWDGIATAD
jgi:LmbE family N-acetylglucosaminyl deacetylase